MKKNSVEEAHPGPTHKEKPQRASTLPRIPLNKLPVFDKNGTSLRIRVIPCVFRTTAVLEPHEKLLLPGIATQRRNSSLLSLEFIGRRGNKAKIFRANEDEWLSSSTTSGNVGNYQTRLPSPADAVTHVYVSDDKYNRPIATRIKSTA